MNQTNFTSCGFAYLCNRSCHCVQSVACMYLRTSVEDSNTNEEGASQLPLAETMKGSQNTNFTLFRKEIKNTVCKCSSYRCNYAAGTSSALYRSSTIQRFECSDTIEISDRMQETHVSHLTMSQPPLPLMNAPIYTHRMYYHSLTSSVNSCTSNSS